MAENWLHREQTKVQVLTPLTSCLTLAKAFSIPESHFICPQMQMMFACHNTAFMGNLHKTFHVLGTGMETEFVLPIPQIFTYAFVVCGCPYK